MSVRVSSKIYRAKLGSAARKSVALKLADCANDDGSSIFPAVKTIAREVELSPRHVKRILKAFVGEKLLVVVKQGGCGPGHTTEYRLDLQKLDVLPRTKPDMSSPIRSDGVSSMPAKGDSQPKKGVTLSAKGDTLTPNSSLSVKEPSEDSPSVDELHRQDLEEGERLKAGAASKRARAMRRRKGELDGSKGIDYSNGKLTVFNGAAAALTADFPGIDIAAVCDRAGPEVARFSYPSADDAMSVLRRHARLMATDPKWSTYVKHKPSTPSRYGVA